MHNIIILYCGSSSQSALYSYVQVAPIKIVPSTGVHGAVLAYNACMHRPSSCIKHSCMHVVCKPQAFCSKAHSDKVMTWCRSGGVLPAWLAGPRIHILGGHDQA
jgi:hypothetical protein